MWLLDANRDVHLSPMLAEFGVPNATAAALGWKDLSNGELVKAASARGFTCLLTRDPDFGESASRALKLFPEFRGSCSDPASTSRTSLPRTVSGGLDQVSHRAGSRPARSLALSALYPFAFGFSRG